MKPEYLVSFLLGVVGAAIPVVLAGIGGAFYLGRHFEEVKQHVTDQLNPISKKVAVIEGVLKSKDIMAAVSVPSRSAYEEFERKVASVLPSAQGRPAVVWGFAVDWKDRTLVGYDRDGNLVARGFEPDTQFMDLAGTKLPWGTAIATGAMLAVVPEPEKVRLVVLSREQVSQQ